MDKNFSKILSKRNSFFKIIILFLIISSSSNAQELRFKNLSVADGLSNNSITAICQDNFGFIWIGTSDGLNKFDGNKFTVYRNTSGDSTSLSDNYILSLCEDKDGYLWIGTDKGGLNRFDPKTETFRHYTSDIKNPNSICNNSINYIIEDKMGNIWIATKHGLSELPAHQKMKECPDFISFTKKGNGENALTDLTIYSMLCDSKGSLWLSYSDGYGVDKLDITGNKSPFFKKINFRKDSPNSISGNWILFVFEDSKGRFWISSWATGLIKYEPSINKFTRYKNDLKDNKTLAGNNVEMAAEDNLGNIWIATYDGGLNKYIEASGSRNEYFAHYKYDTNNPLSLPNNKITILFKDKAGMIWVGTSGHGVSRFNPNSRFKNILLNEPDSEEDIPSAITKTSDGNLWVGTSKGTLFRFNKKGEKEWKYKIRRDEPLNAHIPFIPSLFEDEEKNLWISASCRGIFYIPANSVSSPQPRLVHIETSGQGFDIILKNGFTFIKEDANKNMIIGTNSEIGMLFLSRKNKLKKNFVFERLNKGKYAWEIERDSNDYWIGAWSHGATKFSGKDFSVLKHFGYVKGNSFNNLSIPGYDVYTLLKANDGNIWMGTLNSLTRYTPGNDTLTHYRYKDGLANESVFGILEDDYKNLWISTANGLSKLDLRTELFTNFFKEDGLLANEFAPFAYYKDKSGQLYFGGINGLTVIDPKTDLISTEFPGLHITGLYILNQEQQNKNLIKEGIIPQSFPFSNEITLPYDKNAITIEFSALDYISPQKIKYMYKLEGYNEDWVTIRPPLHSVSFMNLDPDDYTLKIRSTNRDGIWNSQYKIIQLHITPPFWNRLWFKVFAVLFIAGMALLFHEIRVRAGIKRQNELQQLVDQQTLALRERNADLESFSYSVSHDLRAPLRSIFSFSQIIKEDFDKQLPAEAKQYFTKITNAAYNMTALIDGILKFSQVARSELNKKSINISEIARRVSDDIKIIYPDKNIDFKIQPDIIANGDYILITTVLENLFSNSVKFSSNEDEIIIEFGKTRAFDKSKTSLAEAIFIKDNGVGFDMQYAEKLFNVFQRLHTNQEFEGTGIGLANVKKIINKHGGTIWAESEPGKGSVFYFTLS